IGDGKYPDLTGKKVCVIGGGNVAMDVARSSVRLGADKVAVAYRRRKADMTALPEEVESAMAEGVEIMELYAPERIEADEDGQVKALWVSQQMPGEIRGGRPSPKAIGTDSIPVECDIVIAAVGQGIESRYFVEQGIDAKWGVIQATGWTSIQNMPGIFAGGDCATGPATVIRAIAAGKVAAANIDQYLGYNHEITCDVKIPEPDLSDRTPCGRVNLIERPAGERKCDFTLTECGMSLKEAGQEARRCLRCDHFGYGNFKGGRTTSW
ncbi:MAG: FAD-dependent oxidoreductase, partial [Clostridium fessum]